MEKEFFKIRETQVPVGNNFKPEFPIQQPASVGKQVRIFNSVDDAYAAFDTLDDHQGSMEFILRESVQLPPIPSEQEKENYFLKNALLLIDAGEYALARNVLGLVLKKNHTSADAIRWMGWCFKQEQNGLENALKCYEQLVTYRVTDEDLFELGEIYYGLNRFTEAQNAWMDALGQCEFESPRLFDLHKNLGNVYTHLGDFESAEENYNKALLIRPQSDILQVNLGTLNFQRRFFKTALEHFKRAVEINAYNDSGWCGVALVAREMSDFDWSLAVLLKALDLNPYNMTALYVLINWSQADKKYDEVINRIQRYVDRYQDNGDMIYTLAGLHYQNGDLMSAEMELTHLEALQPERDDIDELRLLINQKAIIQSA